jgi:hypothetical protein
MTLSPEVLSAVALSEEEKILTEWRLHHRHCILTSHRLVVLSPHHLLGHPHHEVAWSQPLETVGLVEIKQGMGVLEDSPRPGMASVGVGFGAGLGVDSVGARSETAATGGSAEGHVIPGDFHCLVDNMVVFIGNADEAGQVQATIETAAAERKKSLQGPG